MTVLFLLLSIVASVLQQVARKEYRIRDAGGAFAFSAGGVTVTLLYFFFSAGGHITLPLQAMRYVIPFSLCYTTAYFFTMKALETGPLSITSLLISYSLIVPALYGLVALHEPISLALIVGLILLFLSLALVEFRTKKEPHAFSLRWTLYVAITFFTNGICTTVMKVFQITYQGEYSSSFMVVSLAFTAVVLIVAALLKERRVLSRSLSRGALWFSLCGLGNGAMNQLTLLLAVTLPASFLYPVQAAGTILLSAAVSIFYYREKLSRYQKIGLIIGVLAVVALNL